MRNTIKTVVTALVLGLAAFALAPNQAAAQGGCWECQFESPFYFCDQYSTGMDYPCDYAPFGIYCSGCIQQTMNDAEWDDQTLFYALAGEELEEVEGPNSCSAALLRYGPAEAARLRTELAELTL